MPTFRHRTGGRRANRGDDVIARDVEAADVVQPAVVGLPDQRVDRSHLFVPGLRERIGDDAFDAGADAEGVGEDDRRLDLPELEDLSRSRQLAERVADEHRAGHLVLKEVPAVRQDGRHSGADVVALDDRGVTDLHAGDVGDRVERTRREHAGRKAEVARSRFLLGAARDG
jgi:hypothetical protein